MGDQFGNDLKEAYKRRPLETRKEGRNKFQRKVMLMEC